MEGPRLPPLLASASSWPSGSLHLHTHHPRRPLSSASTDWPDDDKAWIAFDAFPSGSHVAPGGFETPGSPTSTLPPDSTPTGTVLAGSSQSDTNSRVLPQPPHLVDASTPPRDLSTGSSSGGFKPAYTAIIIVILIIVGGLVALWVYKWRSKKHDLVPDQEPPGMPALGPGPHHFAGPLDLNPLPPPPTPAKDSSERHTGGVEENDDPFSSPSADAMDSRPNGAEPTTNFSDDTASIKSTSTLLARKLHGALLGRFRSRQGQIPRSGTGRVLKGQMESTDAYTLLPELISSRRRSIMRPPKLDRKFPSQSKPGKKASLTAAQDRLPKPVHPTPSAHSSNGSEERKSARGEAAWEERVRAYASNSDSNSVSMAGVGAQHVSGSEGSSRLPAPDVAPFPSSAVNSSFTRSAEPPAPGPNAATTTFAQSTAAVPASPSLHMYPGAGRPYTQVNPGSQMGSQCVTPSLWPASTATGPTPHLQSSPFETPAGVMGRTRRGDPRLEARGLRSRVASSRISAPVGSGGMHPAHSYSYSEVRQPHPASEPAPYNAPASSVYRPSQNQRQAGHEIAAQNQYGSPSPLPTAMVTSSTPVSLPASVTVPAPASVFASATVPSHSTPPGGIAPTVPHPAPLKFPLHSAPATIPGSSKDIVQHPPTEPPPGSQPAPSVLGLVPKSRPSEGLPTPSPPSQAEPSSFSASPRRKPVPLSVAGSHFRSRPFSHPTPVPSSYSRPVSHATPAPSSYSRPVSTLRPSEGSAVQNGILSRGDWTTPAPSESGQSHPTLAARSILPAQFSTVQGTTPSVAARTQRTGREPWVRPGAPTSLVQRTAAYDARAPVFAAARSAKGPTTGPNAGHATRSIASAPVGVARPQGSAPSVLPPRSVPAAFARQHGGQRFTGATRTYPLPGNPTGVSPKKVPSSFYGGGVRTGGASKVPLTATALADLAGESNKY